MANTEHGKEIVSAQHERITCVLLIATFPILIITSDLEIGVKIASSGESYKPKNILITGGAGFVCVEIIIPARRMYIEQLV